jgi:hypothetical protein
VILANEHTTGAAEMVTLFAKENSLATIVGTKTPGRLISRTGTKVGAGYQLVFPVAAYQSWNGTRIEGLGIEPDVRVPWSFEDAQRGRTLNLTVPLKFCAVGDPHYNWSESQRPNRTLTTPWDASLGSLYTMPMCRHLSNPAAFIWFVSW